jgi:predicted nucleic-acid-binding protein
VIAIDTNVLLRHLLEDDRAQAKKAHALIRGDHAVLITDVVLVETIWTLKGKKYRADKEDIMAVINGLLAEPNIVFENAHVVWSALNEYRKAKPVKVAGKNKMADYPDALMISKAHYTASKAGEEPEGVYTFDQAAGQLTDAMLL